MTTRVDIEDIQTTRGEKLLALVMTVFLLIGGIWAYHKLEINGGRESPAYTPGEKTAIARSDAAHRRLFTAKRSVARDRSELELAREAYRTAIEAHKPSAGLGARYRRETKQFNAAQLSVLRAQEDVQASDPAAFAARERAGRAESRHQIRDERSTFLLRLGFVLAVMAVSFFGFTRLRRSRYLPLASSTVAAATILAFVMGGDYINNYVRWQDLGPLVLSAVGVALTISAFWGLQRYLAQRIPRWRVRRSECPFCGYPVKDGRHCEGCGRDVVGECAKCSAPRRVGTAFCATCGEA